MKKLYLIIIFVFCMLHGAIAQSPYAETNMGYNRSSIYSILLQHSPQRYEDEIRQVYSQQPLSDKYNDMSLSVIALTSSRDAKHFEDSEVISKFLDENHVAQRLVAKWFNRDKSDGTFDINRLMEMGLYDADQTDLEVSSLLKRGDALLADSGEELIGNTFVLVYDIIYIDKQENAEKVKKGLGIASSLLSIAASILPGGNLVGAGLDLASDIADAAADLTELVAGFKVKIKAHLFQLEWNEEIANTFYALYYIERGTVDETKKMKWEEASSLFKLKYWGSNESLSSNTTLRGLYSPEDVIRKVVYRALNNSMAELQRDNEVFRLKTPISKIDGGKVYASVGMKEGMLPSDVFEVLEIGTDEKGHLIYKKKGTVKPIKIWDNRYMAHEEDAENADLQFTEFEIISGTDFYPGMLLRQAVGSDKLKTKGK